MITFIKKYLKKQKLIKKYYKSQEDYLTFQRMCILFKDTPTLREKVIRDFFTEQKAWRKLKQL